MMPCHITAALERTLPWEKGQEYQCQDCHHIFQEWKDHPFGEPITDLCEDCHAVQHDNDRPEDCHEW